MVAVPAMAPVHLSRQPPEFFLSCHRVGIDWRQRHGMPTRCRDDNQSSNSQRVSGAVRMALSARAAAALASRLDGQ